MDYERLDGKVVTVPCCDVIRTRGRLLCEQRAYLDQSEVFAVTVEGSRDWEDAGRENIGSAIR